MFNLALLLQRNNKHAEAAEYWRRYLAKDGKSEWAARALRNANAPIGIVTSRLTHRAYHSAVIPGTSRLGRRWLALVASAPLGAP